MGGQTETMPAEVVGRSGKTFVAAFIALAVVVGSYFALGMPGMDHTGAAPMSGMDMPDSAVRHRTVSPSEFEKVIVGPETVVINVHVPFEGEITGTDLFLPFDAIAVDGLPRDRSTELAIYCRTGRMSAVAATELLALGYTNIVELEGGMQAWLASGRQLAAANAG